MVLLFLVELQILYHKAAAGRNLVGRVGVAGNDNRQLDDLLKLCDAGVELALLVLRLIVLGVLGKVAEGACFLELLCDFVGAGGLEVFEFFLISVQAFLCQLDFFSRICNPFLFIYIPPFRR